MLGDGTLGEVHNKPMGWECPICRRSKRVDRYYAQLSSCCKKHCRRLLIQPRRIHGKVKDSTTSQTLQWHRIEFENYGKQKCTETVSEGQIRNIHHLPSNIYDMHIDLLKAMREIVQNPSNCNIKALQTMQEDLSHHGNCLSQVNAICEDELEFSLLAVSAFFNDLISCRQLLELGANSEYIGPIILGCSGEDYRLFSYFFISTSNPWLSPPCGCS